MRSPEAAAADFIKNKNRPSYRDYGFKLYAVERKERALPLGICGFVQRDTLNAPDLGCAFLLQSERKGYAFESARAMLNYGRKTLGLDMVFAITSLDNKASGNLLEKSGSVFAEIRAMPDGDVKLYKIGLMD